MAAVAREFPALRLTFNLVPSLLEQLEAFARGDARDPHLELGLRPAEDLTPGEAASCVNEFFHAQYDRMIGPHARYAGAARAAPGDARRWPGVLGPTNCATCRYGTSWSGRPAVRG
jgi:alpha-amylase/alpha-mannosidase (GH57 family)